VLDREQILLALARLAALLRARGAEGEICLLGGTAMVLVFNARPATKDIDAIFQPTAQIRDAARIVQEEMDLPEGWLNDGAKGFVSTNHEVEKGDLPQFEGLRVTAPTAEYMLAMKCMASRIAHSETDPSDVADIRFLLGRLGLRTLEDALAVVARYYPRELVPTRTAYLLEEILSEAPA
jgi:hypothetical protein